MDIETIYRMAEEDAKLSLEELHHKIAFLKSEGCGILECIVYVRSNQLCHLSEAKTIVINLPSWLSQKDDFMRHQEEQMAEFMEAMVEDIEMIKHEYSKDGAKIQIIRKE